MDHSTPSSLRLAEVVASFSLACDLGTGMPMEWAVRSSVIAIRLGECVGIDDASLRDLYYLAMLTYIGCTAESHLFAEMVGDEMAITGGDGQTVDWGNQMVAMRYLVRHVGNGQPLVSRARMMARLGSAGREFWVEHTRAHCEVAQQLCQRLGVQASVQPLLAQAFERWDGKGRPAGTKGEEIALPARIGQLARDVEIFHRLHGLDAAIAIARDRSGGSFDPQLVDVFCRHGASICDGLDAESAWETMLAIEPQPRALLDAGQIDAAALAMADFTDLKVPFLLGHSRGVAALAEAAASQYGLPRQEILAIRRAGLMHDLGRVGVSATTWCKKGALTEGEWERVRLHPYYTERILSRSPGLAPLGRLAGQNHERSDGSGYHRGLSAQVLSPAARVLSAADVYQALTEGRPYRPAWSVDEAASGLSQMARQGQLDPDSVTAVLAAAGHRVRVPRKVSVAGLSNREIEVLRLLARGYSNREMAGQLFISRDTVNHHVRHIYDKIGVSTRPAATLFAVQHGMVATDSVTS